MRSLLVLAALVPCVEALMLTCTPRPRSAKFFVIMLSQSDSALLQNAEEKVAILKRYADMADTAIEAKDDALASKDDLIDSYRMQTYQKDLALSKQVAILHCRSVVEVTATIFCQGDAKFKTFSGMIGKFLNGHVFKKGTKTLTEAADATRVMLDEQPGWSLAGTSRKQVLGDEIYNIYDKMSTEIHYPDTLETGWCVGGPSFQGAAQVIVSTRLLMEVGDRLPLGATPMELVILNPEYVPFKKFLKDPVDGWIFQDYTPTASVSASTPPATRRAARRLKQGLVLTYKAA